MGKVGVAEPAVTGRPARPVYRYLRGYCLDPGFSTRLDTAGINEVIYKIPFELLEPGPIGEYVEVMDFDPASDCWYEPVDLSDEEIASQHGLTPSEGNPQFHQQLVYAVAMKTIRHFERALGRKLVWYPRDKRPAGKSGARREHEYVQRLRIYPHAFRDGNAYYDPDKAALLFGYFDAAHQALGTNYPGGLVFTCLSPDIVAHEMTHAILDSIHHRYIEDTNVDVAAFHEAFADIVGLLQRFTFPELIEHELYRTAGRMDRYTVLGELATQFGEALEGNQGALRSMIGVWDKNRDEWFQLVPNPTDYSTRFEAHDRGAVLVAAIFDTFQRIYLYKTQDLIRIATQGTGVLPEGSISVDLVRRLAGEASEIAEHLLHVCIRALDYCPPHDIGFGDYLRALITADLDIAPEDEYGYRIALIEAFRARGIFPDRVNTLSIESLRWSKPEFKKKEEKAFQWIAREIKPHIRNLVDSRNRRELYDRSREAQEFLHGLLNQKKNQFDPKAWEAFVNALGMTSRPVSTLFDQHSSKVRFLRDDGKPDSNYIPAIEVHTIRPTFRTGREARQIEQVLITLTQKVWVDIGEDGVERLMVFRGGCSLILSLGNLDVVEYVIHKKIKSHRRFLHQVAYSNGETGAALQSKSLYDDDDRQWRLDFNLLHRR